MQSVFYGCPHKGLNLRLENPSEAFLYTKTWKKNLLTQKKSSTSLEVLKARLKARKLNEGLEDRIHVFHIFYEFSYETLDLLVPENVPLILEIIYHKKSFYSIQEKDQAFLEVEGLESPDFSDYEKLFNLGVKELYAGNSYQFNLTFPFSAKAQLKGNPLNLFLHPSEFAHLTQADEKTFLSNSPECLFQIKKEQGRYLCRSAPIKGTMTLEGEAVFDETWKKLMTDPKEKAELFMILDLLRNDLSRIGTFRSKVLSRQRPLRVPGLLHQYGEIEVELEDQTNLYQLLRATFPGGSVVGAPKKRTFEILDELEDYRRGFYCGSTVLWNPPFVTASLNIRSGVLQQEHLTWGAGGGVTVLSKARNEYQEMMAKCLSFLNFFVYR